MGVLEKLRPSRAQAQDMSLIVDLDELLSRPVGFKFRGHVYRVAPVSAKTFLELSENLSKAAYLLERQKSGDLITESQIYEAYQAFISVLVPEFKVDILKQMQIPQVHALLNLIIKHATGQPMSMDDLTEKKKDKPASSSLNQLRVMPMVAFLCHFYGGMPKDWVEVPVRTFFAMHREAVRMEARQYSELADVVLIADNMKISYYEAIKQRYDRIINPERPQLPERPGLVIESGSNDAMALMRGVARGLKRKFGYG